jgi:putative membrane-bound dehydrogenase-like protein
MIRCFEEAQMRSWKLLLVGAVIVLASVAGLPVLAGEFQIGTHTFTLPDGFEIELVTGPPLVDRPIVCDFDDAGRLYVADSSGSNDKVEKQLAEKPHRIVRLEDSDGDGRFDKSIVFADQMMFPEGAMWLEGSLYVAAPPSIWKLTDTDGDGVCDKREEWFAGKTLTGCANDLHGPYAGPDGWIYWCKGAFAKQTYEREGKPPFVTRAAHIFRCRPDGTGLEAVMTGGMDNPVDVVFTPGGERIFSTTFLQNPGGGKRDGLIHAVYGGVYGKIHDVIEDHPRTGDVMPVLSHLGAAAPCGLARYESDVFGKDYQDNLFTCCFNMHKVTRHVLEPHGATFKSTDSDFLVSNNFDFHPTDVQEDADGSLIVVDTGGWYKLCCPTSQLSKPDVLGAIYRVRKTGATKVDDPRGLKTAWAKLSPDQLAPLLGDARPAVQRRAIRELASRGDVAVPVLEEIVQVFSEPRQTTGAIPLKSPIEKQARESVPMRRNAIWALAQIDRPQARNAFKFIFGEPDDTVLQAVANSVSLWRDKSDKDLILKLWFALEQNKSPQVRRLCAEFLGRVGDSAAVPKLLSTARRFDKSPDRVFEHAVIFALTGIADPNLTAEGLKENSPATRRVALIALDQMPGGGLEPQMVAGLLDSKEPLIRETAAWIVGRHPEWGDALADYLRTRLDAVAFPEADAGELEGLLAQFAKSQAVQKLMGQILEDPKRVLQSRHIVLPAIARSGLKEPTAAWIASITRLLASDDVGLAEAAVLAARALPAAKTPDPKFAAALLAVAGRTNVVASIRINALAAVPGGMLDISPALFNFLCGNLRPEHEVFERSSAAEILARAKLSPEQLHQLTESFQVTGPIEADRLLPAFKDANEELLGLKLIDVLRDSPALTGLRIDAVRTAIAKFPAPVQARAEELYVVINVDVARQKEKLETLVATLKTGDVRRGQVVFNTSKAACAACHPFGYLGGNVGPDLTRIGSIRQERDLLESIVFPSASFVRSFEPVIVVTRSGKTYNGLVKLESADEVVLATGPKEVARIARDDIEEMRPSTVSVMPSGLDQQLTPQDLADLVAFLKAAK